MNSTGKNEFYADHLVYELEKVTTSLLKWLWRMGVALFGVVFIALIFQANKMNEYLPDLENNLTTRFSYQEMTLIFSLPFWLWMFLSIFPTLVKWSRRFGLYPKNSVTQQDTVLIQEKEKVIHRHTKRSNSASYYVGVNHPITSQLIKVEIDRESYDALEKGDKVGVKYHPTETNILYLSVPETPISF